MEPLRRYILYVALDQNAKINSLFLIQQGDLVCLEGPVGGGKTALLNAINGNLFKIGGSVQINDFSEGSQITIWPKIYCISNHVDQQALAMLHSNHGCNTAPFVRTFCGAKFLMKIVIKKFFGLVLCIKILRTWVRIVWILVRMAAHCLVDNELVSL